MTYPARISKEMRFERQVPRCPHCGGLNMGDAQISLEALLGGTTPAYVPVAGDGYVQPDQLHSLFVFECPDCLHPSVLVVDDSQVKLIAARTEKDVAYAAEHGIW